MGFRCPILQNVSSRYKPWCLADSYDFIACFLQSPITRPSHVQLHYRSIRRIPATINASSARHFHDYFLTSLNSSSLQSEPTLSSQLHHKPAEQISVDHDSAKTSSAASSLSTTGTSRNTTVVRIPLKSAKQHFGVSQSRGTRPYNEDTYQAGTIEIPAFAKSTCSNYCEPKSDESVDIATGGSPQDPQVFCFGIFDGHGGKECSDFLRERLHEYVESTAELFELGSSLQNGKPEHTHSNASLPSFMTINQEARTNKDLKVRRGPEELSKISPEQLEGSPGNSTEENKFPIVLDETTDKEKKISRLKKYLVQGWKDKVGGYFCRFKPEFFNLKSGNPASIESVLMYAFLKADLDFVTAQAHKPGNEDCNNCPLEAGEKNEISNHIGGSARFFGGSTASIALISSPTPVPFWHPLSSSTMIVAHVGDTRIILCDTITGLAKPCTTNHHPYSPGESSRLRRYATAFITDSFGEERITGLANTRAFGDMNSKRIGVSAEPEIHRIELTAAKYSMLILVSDGVSGNLNDQEIVDIIKEAKSPEQGARDVVEFATEVSKNGDNATCLVVRLGGWEKRVEGGLGSLGTKESRKWRSGDANDMRRGENHR